MSFTFVVGPMYSGKTLALCKEAIDTPGACVLIPEAVATKRFPASTIKDLQPRSTELVGPECKLYSRAAPDMVLLATMIRPGDELVRVIAAINERRGPVTHVFVDEAQFLEARQVYHLRYHISGRQKLPVKCFGLSTGWNGRSIGCSGELLAMATTITRLFTMCNSCCGDRAATMNVKIGPDWEVNDLDATYKSVCPDCWYTNSSCAL